MKRSKDDLIADLEKQKKFLLNSCKAFDEGDEEEALRLATIIRVLVHDTSNSHSLLGQLQIKDSTKFLDSALPIDPQPSQDKHKGRTVFIAHGLPGLIGITIKPPHGGVYIAPKVLREHAAGYQSFDKWWNDKNIPGHDKKRYSRKDLILHMANKEGGAHVDREIDAAYQEFTKSSLGMNITINNIKTGFINSAADVSVRQIAWEVLETLDQEPHNAAQ